MEKFDLDAELDGEFESPKKEKAPLFEEVDPRTYPLTPEEVFPPKSAIQPSKEFDGIDYSSLPAGQREIQERNGVRNHGLIKGNFVWNSEKTVVIFEESETGVFSMYDANKITPAVEDYLNRKFPNLPYVGSGDEVLYTGTMLGIGIDPAAPGKDVSVITKVDCTGFEIEEVLEPDVEKIKEPVVIDSVSYTEPLKMNFPDMPVAWKTREVQYPELIKEMQTVAKFYATNINTEKQKAYVGVDPGKKGAIVAIGEKGIIGKWVIPLLGDDVDAQGVWNILAGLKENYDLVLILEEVHSLFGMSAATNFSMGHTLGILLGIIVTSKIKLIRVNPKAWQKEIWQTSEIQYKPMKPDQKKASIDTKLTSMKAAHRLFPDADFRATSRSKNDHDGICDSVCLAEYGRRKNL